MSRTSSPDSAHGPERPLPAPVRPQATTSRPPLPRAPGAIADVHARQLLDSRGAPTLEAEIRLVSGARGRAMLPSGASTGPYESRESRDRDRRFRGHGVRAAVARVRGEIADALRGRDATDQAAIDRVLVELDGTPDRRRLGANALLATSLACAHAAAAHERVSLWRYLAPGRAHMLPVPMVCALDGGAHARNAFDVQEAMIVPWQAESYADALDVAVRVHWALGDLLAERGQPTAVGDTGGFAPDFPHIEEALELLERAVERAGFHAGEQVVFALDAAAGQWRSEGSYRLAAEGSELSANELVERWLSLVRRFPIVSLEDPIAEDDHDGWRDLRRGLGDRRVQLLGDDLFATNADRIRGGVRDGLATGALIKPNQVGTLSETLAAARVAQEAGWAVVVSHRSGDTEDPTIADLAVGLQAGQIKAGGPCRGERVAKHNRLMRIEEEIGDEALYAGRAPFDRRPAGAGRSAGKGP